jgi:hypothetical protein
MRLDSAIESFVFWRVRHHDVSAAAATRTGAVLWGHCRLGGRLKKTVCVETTGRARGFIASPLAPLTEDTGKPFQVGIEIFAANGIKFTELSPLVKAATKACEPASGGNTFGEGNLVSA